MVELIVGAFLALISVIVGFSMGLSTKKKDSDAN